MIATSRVSDQETRAYLAQFSRRHQQQVTQPARGRSWLENFFANWGGNANGGFQGGRIDRLTEDWNPGRHGRNCLYQMGVARMRERDRLLRWTRNSEVRVTTSARRVPLAGVQSLPPGRTALQADGH